MKNFSKAALSAGVMLAALNRASSAEAPKDPRDDDAPGMEACGDKATAPSFSKEGDAASEMQRTFEVPRPIVYDTTTVDEGGIVQLLGDNAVFTSGPDNIVRYHANGITVSRMRETDDLDDSHHNDAELSTLLKDSLPTTHAKPEDNSGIPTSTFSSFPSTSSSSSFHSTSSSTSSSSTTSSTSPDSTSEDLDSEVKSDVCAATPYIGTLNRRGHSPSLTLRPVDTATTTTAAGGSKGDTHATASADSRGDTHATAGTNSGTRFVDDSSNGGKGMGNDHDHTNNDESNKHRPEPERTLSTTRPPTSATDDVKPSVWSPGPAPTVGDKLIAEPSVASVDTSAVSANKHDEIISAKSTANPSDASSDETSKGFHTSTLVAADKGKLERVYRARELIEELEGDLPTHENKRSVWGWTPFRSQLQKDVELVREHFGDTWMTLTDRACLEVYMDGICVLSKCGPYKREWMNRFPWRRSKNNDYQLYVVDDGVEVRLGKRRVWGVSVHDNKG